MIRRLEGLCIAFGWVFRVGNKERAQPFRPPHPSLLPEGEGARPLDSAAWSFAGAGPSQSSAAAGLPIGY